MNKPWQPLRIPSAITPIGQLHQSPPSPIPWDQGRGPSHHSHVLEHRDTYGQAQVCSKGHQGSSVDRPCQPSIHLIKFWLGRNPLLKVFDYVSVSQCATGPARESEVYFKRPQMEKTKTNAHITPIRLLPGNSAPLGVINMAATRGGNGSHSRGGGGLVSKNTSPVKNKNKTRRRKPSGSRSQVPPMANHGTKRAV